MKRKILIHYLLAVLFFTGISFQTLANNGPTEQIKSSVNSILEVLRNKDMPLETRKNKVKMIIEDRFYYKAIAQRTLGRNWRKASPEQQDRFIELFSKLLEKTYLGRIEEYTNEKVEYIREKPVTDTRAVVYTEIITGNTNIPINYKVALKDGKWLVYDVIIEEVSLISNYRTTYNEIIDREGISGLLTQLEKKIQDVEQGKEPSEPAKKGSS